MSQQQLRRLQVLLVDSDPHSREKVQQALDNGFILRFARSLEEARHSLEEFTPDILICEVLLPDNASGLDLCRLIRSSEIWRHLPVMLLTNLSTLQDKIAGFDAGADDYVVKPFDARYLTGRVRLLSRIKHMEYENN